MRPTCASSMISTMSSTGTDEAFDGEVPELRFLPLTPVRSGVRGVELLGMDERRRAARLRNPDDRERYIVAHVFLRRLLAERLGSAPQDVSFVQEACPSCGAPRGRPAVSGSPMPLHFSLSRSRGWAVVAIASQPVGVDIEAVPDRETATEVSTLLHADERVAIASAPVELEADLVARIWTRKEAYLKAIGVGLAHELASEYLAAKEICALPPGWAVSNVDAPHGYAAAFALGQRRDRPSGALA
jgi:4'-phosphopantetheinyl transferase